MPSQYVGIDLHRRRSVIVRKHIDGTMAGPPARVVNDPVEVARVVTEAGPCPEVVVEATYGWYWLVDLLTDLGAVVHLAHPLGLAWGHRRRKDDVTDASDLVDLLRMGRLPEAWIAPPEVRQLRELVRYRARLVELRTGLKNQAHAVLAKEGVAVPVSDLFGLAGTRLLKEVELADAYRIRVESLCGLMGEFDREVRTLDGQIHRRLSDETGYRTVQQIPGVGRVVAAIFVAEIGDVGRFPSPRHLCSWAGLTPRHRESDGVVRRGPITKQGSGLLRWAAVEAAQKLRVGSWLKTDFVRIASQRGRPIARVAVARILSLAYYGLRDGHIRSLATGEGA